MARNRSKPPLGLYLDGGIDCPIVDQRGDAWPLDEARAAWEAGKVTDYNVAFLRLADLGFDLDALRDYYARCGR